MRGRALGGKGLAVLFGGGVRGGAVLAAGQAQEGAKSVATDRNGDLLPPGALARLGSLRWRHGEPVLFVAFVQDGQAVLTGGQDQGFPPLNPATRKEIPPFAMQANPQGKTGNPPPAAPPPP